MFFAVAAVIAGAVFVLSDNGINFPTKLFGPNVPTAIPYSPAPAVTASATVAPISADMPVPEINLDIPFTSQAPHRNWDLPYKEFCEEASVLMAISFVKGLAIPNADFANARMLEIKSFEEKRFGYFEDTSAEETAAIIKEFYKFPAVKVASNPSITDIKLALSQGRAVIVPAAGRQLGNPYYTQPGPLYHMLVIKGYTRDGKFITNDPGTRRGADFLYEPDVLWNAIHDWNGGDVKDGRKVMLVVG